MPTAVVLPFWFDRPEIEALEIAVAAEEHGYAELWVGEMQTFDAFALSGAIARQTKHIEIVVGPLPLATRDPAALALGVASVATLAGRRVHIALGASTPTVVSRWHGRPWRRTITLANETIAALRPLLAGERLQFAGELVRCDGFRLQAPPPPADICLAAFAPRMLETASIQADRVVVNLITPSQVERVRRRMTAACAAAGKEIPPLTVWIPAAIDPNENTWQQLARQLVAYVAAPGYAEMFEAAGFTAAVRQARAATHPRQALAAIPRELIHAVAAIGDIETVRARLAAFRAAGAGTIAIVPSTANDPGAKRLLGRLQET